MSKREIIIMTIGLFASNLLLLVILSAITFSARSIVIFGWSLIALQALATGILYVAKKNTIAMVGLIWVSASVIIQLVPWVYLFKR